MSDFLPNFNRLSLQNPTGPNVEMLAGDGWDNDYPEEVRNSELFQWLWWGNGHEWMEAVENRPVPYNDEDAAFIAWRNRAKDVMDDDIMQLELDIAEVATTLEDLTIEQNKSVPNISEIRAFQEQARDEYATLCEKYKRLPPLGLNDPENKDTLYSAVNELNLKSVPQEGDTATCYAVLGKIFTYRKKLALVAAAAKRVAAAATAVMRFQDPTDSSCYRSAN